MRPRIEALARDFPAVWNNPKTSPKDRKRMAALLIEDVTLLRDGDTTMHIRLRGGACRSLTVPAPLNAWQRRCTPPELLAEIDALLQDHTDKQTVAILNQRGRRTGAGDPFTTTALRWVRYHHGLKSLRTRLRDAGWITANELGQILGLPHAHLGRWRGEGKVRGRRCNDGNFWLYEPAERQPEEIRRKAKGNKMIDEKRPRSDAEGAV